MRICKTREGSMRGNKTVNGNARDNKTSTDSAEGKKIGRSSTRSRNKDILVITGILDYLLASFRFDGCCYLLLT